MDEFKYEKSEKCMKKTYPFVTKEGVVLEKRTWPYMSTAYHLKDRLPQPEHIMICYFVGTGANFISRVLSCSESLYGEKHFDVIGGKFKNLKKEEIDGDTWFKISKGSYHPIFNGAHARFFNFDDWLNFPKVMYIDFDTDNDLEVDWLLKRRNYLTNSSIQRDVLCDVSIRYEKELIKYLKQNKKDFYTFPHISLLNGNTFAKEINKCCGYYNFEKINEEKIIAEWKRWMKANLKLVKEHDDIPYHETNGPYDDF